MRIALSLILISCFWVLPFSCGENLGESRKSNPQEPSPSSPKKYDSLRNKPLQIPDSTFQKKRKSHPMDSLKPKMALL
ncbi:MAG: hypothetical protein AAFX53_00180 [Bacteroidota bacterium]